LDGGGNSLDDILNELT